MPDTWADYWARRDAEKLKLAAWKALAKTLDEMLTAIQRGDRELAAKAEPAIGSARNKLEELGE